MKKEGTVSSVFVSGAVESRERQICPLHGCSHSCPFVASICFDYFSVSHRPSRCVMSTVYWAPNHHFIFFCFLPLTEAHLITWQLCRSWMADYCFHLLLHHLSHLLLNFLPAWLLFESLLMIFQSTAVWLFGCWPSWKVKHAYCRDLRPLPFCPVHRPKQPHTCCEMRGCFFACLLFTSSQFDAV